MFANALAKAACAAAMSCAPAQPAAAPSPAAAVSALLAGGPASGLLPSGAASLLSGGAPKLPSAKAAAASLLGAAPAAGLMQKGAALLSAAPAGLASRTAQSAPAQAAEGIQPGVFTAIGDLGEFRLDGVRKGVHDGAPVRFLDFTLKNGGPNTTFPRTLQQVRWQGRQSGDQATPLRRDGTHFGMYDQTIAPGQTMAVTYAIPDREEVDGVTVEYGHVESGVRKRALAFDRLAAPVATDVSARAAAPKAGGPGTLTVPAGAAAFQHYGPWQFKVDELLRGPDGHIQAVISVRNASRQRLPFTITDFDAYLIDENGRTIQRLGNLYRGSPGGPIAALVNAGSSYLEPEDQIRARLLFPNTKRFAPVQLRLKEPVKSQTANTYPMS